MRKIKFRVWNKRTNNWVDGCGRHENSSLDGVNLFGETILLGAFMNEVSLDELNDCVALQYTGLKDKNGHEIFEGDIVLGSMGRKHIVEYKENQNARFCFTDIDGKDFSFAHSFSKVIGNIYENPELLK